MKNLIILILFSFLTAQLSAQNYISINSNVNNVSCFGLSDASIVLDIVSSDPPYSIVWSNGATIDNLSFLPAGLYSVTITDSFQQVSETFEITQPDSIQISALVIDNMCYGSSDGEIELSILGGNPPYSYLWANNQTDSSLSGLAAGNYYVTVKDADELNGPAPRNWSYFNTGSNQSIVIPMGIAITINGIQISEGDWICAMYDSLGTLVCGSSGPTPYNSAPSSAVAGTYYFNPDSAHAIAAWGTEIGLNNGFAEGELLKFFVWTASDSMLYPMEVTTPFSTLYITNGTLAIFGMSYSSTGFGCEVSTEILVDQPDSFYVSNQVIDPNCFLCNDGEISIDVFGGNQPYSYLWSDGQTDNTIIDLAAGMFIITVTDNLLCEIIDTINIAQLPYILPEWYIDSTSINHSLIIDDTIDITINGLALTMGDIVGVFYDSIGNMICGGYSQWLGEDLTVEAYGIDPMYEGFESGELFKWKIWSVTDGQEFDAVATYEQTSSAVDGANFITGGQSILTSLSATTLDYQYIYLQSGWSLFSTYVNPLEPSVDSLFLSISNDVIIVKDGDGQVYWPAYNLNLIGDLEIGNGYFLKMSNSQLLIVRGNDVSPENTPINLPSAWSLLGYTRDKSGLITEMLYSISSNIHLVKDGNGNVYWPLYQVNDIGYMNPGQGYLINMNSPQTFTYPSN